MKAKILEQGPWELLQCLCYRLWTDSIYSQGQVCILNPFSILNATEIWLEIIFYLNYENLPSWHYCSVLTVETRQQFVKCEIFSKPTVNVTEWLHWRFSGVFIVSFEQISQIVPVFLLLTLNIPRIELGPLEVEIKNIWRFKRKENLGHEWISERNIYLE